MKTFKGLDELEKAIGTHVGFSPWHRITQDQIDLFADATGDHQWIHVDTERAARGPFGGTIAHGYLTLSLIPKMLWEVYTIEGISMGVNYGADKLRFPSPVPVDSEVRAGVELISLAPGSGGQVLTSKVTVEIKDSAKPACVIEMLSVLIP